MVGDGQRIAVLPVAELELALEMGAPQIVGRCSRGELGSTGSMAGSAESF